MGANVRLVVLLALRNVAAHRVKSAIVGSILFFGTFLVVSGRALIHSIEHAMETSITSSLAGHLQVYAKDAKDPLALFGGGGFGSSDIGEIPDASTALAPIEALDNVKGVVPMGITNATVFSGNELDGVLAELRDAVGRGDTVARDAGVARVRAIVGSLGKGLIAAAAQATDRARAEEDRAALTRVMDEAFWAEFAADPLPALDFLDAKVAPLAADGRLLYLRTIGTDLGRFGQSFDRFYMVDGEPIPPGKRGYLFSKRTYERIVKNKVARELDAIHEEVTEKGKTVAGDTLLGERVARMARQFQRVTFQLSPEEARTLEAQLATELGETGPLDTLVQHFLTVDDANLERRYAFFYEVVAPMIQLYDVPVGSVVTLRAYTKSGFVKSINVKVYGTYEFKGLEKSDLSSASNLTDMITFRELYGKMSDEQKAELAAISASVGVVDVTRDDAEAALFGGGTAEVADPSAALPPPQAPWASAEPDAAAPAPDAQRQETGPRTDERVYSEEEIRRGLALNAAILLEDPSRIEETRAAIEARIEKDGLNLKVVNWQEAAGLLGQFILVIRAVLTVAIAIIFLVAMVIINNSMVMATMDRVAEIGTMRAIGAHRRWVVGVFLLETLLLGVLAGGAGAIAGIGLVEWLGHKGLPAASDALVVLFAGPRLYPTWSGLDVVFGLVVVTLVGLASTLYPAVLASRIQPVVAMQGKE